MQTDCFQNEYASLKSIQDTVVEEQSRVRNELKVQAASVKPTESVRKLKLPTLQSHLIGYMMRLMRPHKLQFDSVPKKKGMYIQHNK